MFAVTFRNFQQNLCCSCNRLKWNSQRVTISIYRLKLTAKLLTQALTNEALENPKALKPKVLFEFPYVCRKWTAWTKTQKVLTPLQSVELQFHTTTKPTQSYTQMYKATELFYILPCSAILNGFWPQTKKTKNMFCLLQKWDPVISPPFAPRFLLVNPHKSPGGSRHPRPVKVEKSCTRWGW